MSEAGACDRAPAPQWTKKVGCHAARLYVRRGRRGCGLCDRGTDLRFRRPDISCQVCFALSALDEIDAESIGRRTSRARNTAVFSCRGGEHQLVQSGCEDMEIAMKRRQFLKWSLAGAAVVALSPPVRAE